MSIPVVCPRCSARLNAPDTAAGKKVRCPKCQTPMAVPAVDEVEVVDDPAPPRRSARPAAKRDVEVDEDDRPRRRRARDEEDEDDRPRKRKKAKSGPPMGLLIGALLVLAGGGFAVYWFGFRDQGGGAAADVRGGGGPGGGPGGGGAGGKAAVPAGWVAVTPPGAGFKAYMPGAPPNAQQPFPSVARATGPVRHAYTTLSPDQKAMYAVTVLVFPDRMAVAERDKHIADQLGREMPGEFVREVSTGKARLGGQEATELVREVNLAAMRARKGGGPTTGPGGQPLPDTMAFVVRYAHAGNRVYVAGLVGFGGRPAEADEKGFFDNFEILAEGAPAPGPKPPDATGPAPKGPDASPKPPEPKLPAPPPGWVAYSDFAKRFRANIPSGGQVTVDDGRLAFLDEVGKGQIPHGTYCETTFKDRGLTLSVRMLTFAREAAEPDRAELLAAYVRRITDPALKEPRVSPVTWFGHPATESVAEGPGVSEARRYAVVGGVGYVVTVRGTNRPAFDELRQPLFDNFLPSPGATVGGRSIVQKGRHELHSDAGMFRIEFPGPPDRATDTEKVLAEAKATGELHTTTVDRVVYHAGYFRYPDGATPADKKRIRELVAATLAGGTPATLPKPIPFPGSPPRSLAWEEYQRRGTETQAGFVIGFHESDRGVVHVRAARGVGVFNNQDRNHFFQSFEPLW